MLHLFSAIFLGFCFAFCSSASVFPIFFSRCIPRDLLFGVNAGIICYFCSIPRLLPIVHMFSKFLHIYLAISSVASFYFHIVLFYVGAISTPAAIKVLFGLGFMGENTLCGFNIEGNAISALMSQDMGGNLIDIVMILRYRWFYKSPLIPYEIIWG